MNKMLKFLLLMGITGLMAGCRLAVIVVEGGEVQSTSNGVCVAGSICIVDVDDPNFYETFTAVPEEGWHFHGWNKGDRFFCAGYKRPECTLTFEGYEETVEVQEMVASSELFYLMPVFKEEVRFVKIAGREWLQPFDFRGYSHADIAGVCSVESGLCSGTLPGSSTDLTGYYWASVSDIEGLFSAYGAEPPFELGVPFNSPDGKAVEKFCRDFLPTLSLPGREEDVIGHLRGSSIDSDDYDSATVLCAGYFAIFSSSTGEAKDFVGSWFWRPEV